MTRVVLLGILAFAGTMSADGAPPRLGFADAVEVQGELRDRLERACARLASPPLDDPDFVLSDVTFAHPRRFTEYSGDISGRMLGALTAADTMLQRSSPIIATLMEGFARHQKPDGHFGADQNLAAGVDQARDMPILWGNGRLLLALAERYRREPRPATLAMIRRLAEYAVSTRPYYGLKENFERVGGQYASGFTTCYPSLIDGLAAAADVTGEARFLEEAKFIARLSLLDKGFAQHHSHGRLTAYRGMLDVDRLSGAAEFLPAVEAGWRTIMADYLLPTGGVTEVFSRDYALDEGCSEADWVRVNLFLWQATGNPAYLDAAEAVLRNHMLAFQCSNGGFGHRGFTALHDGGKTWPAAAVGNISVESYWCCAMHGAQLLAELPRWSVLADGDAIALTWLCDVRATIRLDRRSCRVEAVRERSNRWNIRLTADGSEPLRFRLRVPGWTDSIRVDGTEAKGSAGWVEITRTAPCTFSVELPEEVRLAGAYGPSASESEPSRLFAGADLLCLPHLNLDERLAHSKNVLRVLLSERKFENGRLPVLVEGADETGSTLRVAANLVPICARPPGGCHVLFRVTQADKATSDRVAASAPAVSREVPFEVVLGCDGRLEAYLNGRRLHAVDQWIQAPTVETAGRPGRNVLALRVSSQSKHPGFSVLVRTDKPLAISRTAGWTAVACPADRVPDGWLTDPRQGTERAVAIADVGGFGDAPWYRHSAAFAGTGARWIWAATPPNAADVWLFRCEFDLPDDGR